MRWLFLFVLSLNLAYIAWQLNHEPDAPVTSTPSLKGVPTIMLLSELSNEPSEPRVAAQQEMPGQAPLEEEVQPAAKTETVEVAEPVPAVVEKANVIPKPVETESADKAITKAAEAAVAVPAAQQPRCYTLGPFRDLDKLRALTRDIKSYVEMADFRGKEETEQSLYWVYIRPLKSRQQAIATGKRLRAKKIRDFYIIREGDNVNGISLGYFRNKNGAEGLAKKVRKQGFNASLEPVFKTYTVYWLDYRLAPDKSIPQDLIDQHIKLNGSSPDRVGSHHLAIPSG